MAIYHLSVKTVSRSTGRSAVAAAAYRARERIVDERTGQVHNYTRKQDVISAEIVLPVDAPAWAHDRAALWNAAEKAETRKNSTVAREFEVALPSELTKEEQQKLAHEFAKEIVERHGCAADVAIHAPSRNWDERNYHAHILLTTRRLGPGGFTEKTRELDDKKSGSELIIEWRGRWAETVNMALERAGVEARVDHRSLAAQGDGRLPGIHLGPHVTAMERRGIQTDRGNIHRARQADNGRIISLEEHRRRLEQEKQELEEALSISRLAQGVKGWTQCQSQRLNIPDPIRATVAEALDGHVRIIGDEIHADPRQNTAFRMSVEDLDMLERLKVSGIPPAVVVAELERGHLTTILRHRAIWQSEREGLVQAVERAAGRRIERITAVIPVKATILEASGREVDLEKILEFKKEIE